MKQRELEIMVPLQALEVEKISWQKFNKDY